MNAKPVVLSLFFLIFFIGIISNLIASDKVSANITLLRPQAYEVFNTEYIEVEGQLQNLSQLFINGKFIETGPTADFLTKVNLNYGLNQLYILGQNFTQNYQKQITLTVFRLKDFADLQSSAESELIRKLATVYNLSGYQGLDYFYPNKNISRAEVAGYLTRFLNLPVTPTSNISLFKDVLLSNWALPYIDAVYKNQVMAGVSQKQFAPQGLLSRIDSLMLILRLLEVHTFSSFRSIASDLPEGFWANQYIATAKDLNLIPQRWLNTDFEPYRAITRAEFFSLVYQLPKVKQDIARYFRKGLGESLNKTTMDSDENLKSIKKSLVIIDDIWADPMLLVNSQKKLIRLYVKISNPELVKSVAINLAALGSLDNLKMFDDGRWYDEVAADGIYTAAVSSWPGIGSELKILPVCIYDKDGAKSNGEISLEFLTEDQYAARQKYIAPEVISDEKKVSSNVKEQFFYTVKSGDSLAIIAKKFTGDAHNWLEIAKLNNIRVEYLKNKDGKIYPRCEIRRGQKVLIFNSVKDNKQLD